jgi:hypothetical protein
MSNLAGCKGSYNWLNFMNITPQNPTPRETLHTSKTHIFASFAGGSKNRPGGTGSCCARNDMMITAAAAERALRLIVICMAGVRESAGGHCTVIWEAFCTRTNRPMHYHKKQKKHANQRCRAAGCTGIFWSRERARYAKKILTPSPPSDDHTNNNCFSHLLALKQLRGPELS